MPVAKQHQPAAGILQGQQMQVTSGTLKDRQAHSVAQHS